MLISVISEPDLKSFLHGDLKALCPTAAFHNPTFISIVDGFIRKCMPTCSLGRLRRLMHSVFDKHLDWAMKLIDNRIMFHGQLIDYELTDLFPDKAKLAPKSMQYLFQYVTIDGGEHVFRFVGDLISHQPNDDAEASVARYAQGMMVANKLGYEHDYQAPPSEQRLRVQAFLLNLRS